ncbi:MAG: NAD-binding protein [Methanobrevibacter sp.]|nr:NAD-binding protein [Candidatus Methanovirga australis]
MENKYLLEKSFFEEIRKITMDKKAKKLIVVEHAVPTVISFIKSLTIDYDIVFIKKPNSIHEPSKLEISKYTTYSSTTKNQLTDPEYLIWFIEKNVGEDTFAIIDMGGYFSINLDILNNLSKKGQLFGIIEDTENGFQKYENGLLDLENKNREIFIPLMSVDRSSLKDGEDFLVSNEIVIKSETFLSDHGTTILGKKILVIGFGKIGRNIANALRNRGGIVFVVDNNPTRQILAIAQGYPEICIEKAINCVELVYIANGERSLDVKRLIECNDKLLYLFSVTSVDDTYKNCDLLKQKEFNEESMLTHVKIKSGINGELIFANNGNAMNFTITRNTTVSSFVQLTQAEIMYILGFIYIVKPEYNIKSLNNPEKHMIAHIWLKHWQQLNSREK